MPDFTLELTWTCATNYFWQTDVKGSKGDVYVVHWGRLPEARAMEAGVSHGWQCECKGYKFRGTCKHIAEVEAEGRRCAWNAELAIVERPLNASKYPECPECGGPVRAMRVAV